MCVKVSRREVTDGKNYLEEIFALGISPSGFLMFFKVNLSIKVDVSIVMSLLVIFQPLYVRTFSSMTFPWKNIQTSQDQKKGKLCGGGKQQNGPHMKENKQFCISRLHLIYRFRSTDGYPFKVILNEYKLLDKI